MAYLTKKDIINLNDIFKDVELDIEIENKFKNWVSDSLQPAQAFIDPTYKYTKITKNAGYSDMSWEDSLYRWENENWILIIKKRNDFLGSIDNLVEDLIKQGAYIIYNW